MRKSELREYWENYQGKKVKYTAFYERVKRAWFTKEKAIKPVSKFLKTKKLPKRKFCVTAEGLEPSLSEPKSEVLSIKLCNQKEMS